MQEFSPTKSLTKEQAKKTNVSTLELLSIRSSTLTNPECPSKGHYKTSMMGFGTDSGNRVYVPRTFHGPRTSCAGDLAGSRNKYLKRLIT